jgi:transposase
MAYPIEMHRQVLILYDAGKTTKQISQALSISPAFARRVRQRRHERPKKIGGSKPKLDAAAQAKLIEWLREKPDATLKHLQARLARELNERVSIGCLWNTLDRMKFALMRAGLQQYSGTTRRYV